MYTLGVNGCTIESGGDTLVYTLGVNGCTLESGGDTLVYTLGVNGCTIESGGDTLVYTLGGNGCTYCRAMITYKMQGQDFHGHSPGGLTAKVLSLEGSTVWHEFDNN